MGQKIRDRGSNDLDILVLALGIYQRQMQKLTNPPYHMSDNHKDVIPILFFCRR